MRDNSIENIEQGIKQCEEKYNKFDTLYRQAQDIYASTFFSGGAFTPQLSAYASFAHDGFLKIGNFKKQKKMDKDLVAEIKDFEQNLSQNIKGILDLIKTSPFFTKLEKLGQKVYIDENFDARQLQTFLQLYKSCFQQKRTHVLNLYKKFENYRNIKNSFKNPIYLPEFIRKNINSLEALPNNTLESDKYCSDSKDINKLLKLEDILNETMPEFERIILSTLKEKASYIQKILHDTRGLTKNSFVDKNSSETQQKVGKIFWACLYVFRHRVNDSTFALALQNIESNEIDPEKAKQVLSAAELIDKKVCYYIKSIQIKQKKDNIIAILEKINSKISDIQSSLEIKIHNVTYLFSPPEERLAEMERNRKLLNLSLRQPEKEGRDFFGRKEKPSFKQIPLQEDTIDDIAGSGEEAEKILQEAQNYLSLLESLLTLNKYPVDDFIKAHKNNIDNISRIASLEEDDLTSDFINYIPATELQKLKNLDKRCKAEISEISNPHEYYKNLDQELMNFERNSNYQDVLKLMEAKEQKNIQKSIFECLEKINQTTQILISEKLLDSTENQPIIKKFASTRTSLKQKLGQPDGIGAMFQAPKLEPINFKPDIPFKLDKNITIQNIVIDLKHYLDNLSQPIKNFIDITQKEINEDLKKFDQIINQLNEINPDIYKESLKEKSRIDAMADSQGNDDADVIHYLKEKNKKLDALKTNLKDKLYTHITSEISALPQNTDYADLREIKTPASPSTSKSSSPDKIIQEYIEFINQFKLEKQKIENPIQLARKATEAVRLLLNEKIKEITQNIPELYNLNEKPLLKDCVIAKYKEEQKQMQDELDALQTNYTEYTKIKNLLNKFKQEKAPQTIEVPDFKSSSLKNINEKKLNHLISYRDELKRLLMAANTNLANKIINLEDQTTKIETVFEHDLERKKTAQDLLATEITNIKNTQINIKNFIDSLNAIRAYEFEKSNITPDDFNNLQETLEETGIIDSEKNLIKKADGLILKFAENIKKYEENNAGKVFKLAKENFKKSIDQAHPILGQSFEENLYKTLCNAAQTEHKEAKTSEEKITALLKHKKILEDKTQDLNKTLGDYEKFKNIEEKIDQINNAPPTKASAEIKNISELTTKINDIQTKQKNLSTEKAALIQQIADQTVIYTSVKNQLKTNQEAITNTCINPDYCPSKKPDFVAADTTIVEQEKKVKEWQESLDTLNHPSENWTDTDIALFGKIKSEFITHKTSYQEEIFTKNIQPVITSAEEYIKQYQLNQKTAEEEIEKNRQEKARLETEEKTRLLKIEEEKAKQLKAKQEAEEAKLAEETAKKQQEVLENIKNSAQEKLGKLNNIIQKINQLSPTEPKLNLQTLDIPKEDLVPNIEQEIKFYEDQIEELNTQQSKHKIEYEKMAAAKREESEQHDAALAAYQTTKNNIATTTRNIKNNKANPEFVDFKTIGIKQYFDEAQTCLQDSTKTKPEKTAALQKANQACQTVNQDITQKFQQYKKLKILTKIIHSEASFEAIADQTELTHKITVIQNSLIQEKTNIKTNIETVEAQLNTQKETLKQNLIEIKNLNILYISKDILSPETQIQTALTKIDQTLDHINTLKLLLSELDTASAPSEWKPETLTQLTTGSKSENLSVPDISEINTSVNQYITDIKTTAEEKAKQAAEQKKQQQLAEEEEKRLKKIEQQKQQDLAKEKKRQEEAAQQAHKKASNTLNETIENVKKEIKNCETVLAAIEKNIEAPEIKKIFATEQKTCQDTLEELTKIKEKKFTAAHIEEIKNKTTEIKPKTNVFQQKIKNLENIKKAQESKKQALADYHYILSTQPPVINADTKANPGSSAEYLNSLLEETTQLEKQTEEIISEKIRNLKKEKEKILEDIDKREKILNAREKKLMDKNTDLESVNAPKKTKDIITQQINLIKNQQKGLSTQKSALNKMTLTDNKIRKNPTLSFNEIKENIDNKIKIEIKSSTSEYKTALKDAKNTIKKIKTEQKSITELENSIFAELKTLKNNLKKHKQPIKSATKIIEITPDKKYKNLKNNADKLKERLHPGGFSTLLAQFLNWFPDSPLKPQAFIQDNLPLEQKTSLKKAQLKTEAIELNQKIQGLIADVEKNQQSKEKPEKKRPKTKNINTYIHTTQSFVNNLPNKPISTQAVSAPPLEQKNYAPKNIAKENKKLEAIISKLEELEKKYNKAQLYFSAIRTQALNPKGLEKYHQLNQNKEKIIKYYLKIKTLKTALEKNKKLTEKSTSIENIQIGFQQEHLNDSPNLNHGTRIYFSPTDRISVHAANENTAHINKCPPEDTDSLRGWLQKFEALINEMPQMSSADRVVSNKFSLSTETVPDAQAKDTYTF